jgi:multiple sugar transport system permease protein
MWLALFEPRRGLVNAVLSGLGTPDEALPQWLWEATGVNQSIVEALGLRVDLPWALAGPSLALVAVMVCHVWVFTGYNALFFLAGLGHVPQDVYQAARIDGAGRWSTLRHVTLPLLAPTTFFLTTLGVINACQALIHIYVMTQPLGLTGPQFSTAANTVYIWDQFQRSSRYGYASAMAFILFGLLLALTRLQDRKRVHHG